MRSSSTESLHRVGALPPRDLKWLRLCVTTGGRACIMQGETEPLFQILDLAYGVPVTRIPTSDVRITAHESIGIDEVRTLAHNVQLKPEHRSSMLHVVVASALTREAQHALLKICEEPPSHASVVILLPRSIPIIDTLRSRILVIVVPTEERADNSANSSLSVKEALARVVKGINAYKEHGDQTLLDQIEGSLAVLAHRQTSTAPKAESLHRSVDLLARYRAFSGASQKMLFEHASLSQCEHNTNI
jgi:hypothetical protein